jgi:segregation and condensation protein B
MLNKNIQAIKIQAITISTMSLKAKIEAIIYAAEEPVTVDQILGVITDDLASEQAADVSYQATGTEGAYSAPAPSQDPKQQRDRGRKRVREIIEQLASEYDSGEHGLEIRQIAGGYRMSTKPEHHDAVRAFAKSLKPPIKLSLQALETLAVIAYKQPVTAPEISEIRGVDSSGVLASLISRKLITTAGRKQVIGRPILYKTTKDFLLRFGLKDLNELPSIEEFEKLTAAAQSDIYPAGAVADATGVPDTEPEPNESAGDHTAAPDAESADAEGHFQEKAVESTGTE